MFRLGKFRLVAASLLCVLLLGTNAGARPNSDESSEEAADLNNQAVLCVKDRQYGQAIELLKKAIAIRPDLPRVHYNLGRIYMVRNELDLAIEAFKHAVDLNPKYVLALHALGI